MKDPRKLSQGAQINVDPLLEAMIGQPRPMQQGLPDIPSMSDVYAPDRVAAERSMPVPERDEYMMQMYPERKVKRSY